MPSSLPLYYAGVASDDDALEEMLTKDKKLEHGFSSTMDLHVQRLLGVSYHQVSVSKVKKVTIAGITLVAIILFFSLTFHSARKSAEQEAAFVDKRTFTDVTMTTTQPMTTRESQALNGEQSKTSASHILTTKSPQLTATKKVNKIQTTHQQNPENRYKPTVSKQGHHTHREERIDNVPLTVQPKLNTDFVLAMNPRIPIDLNIKCRTCALVTNSADLLGSNAGSVIDSSDCVIRLNTAPTAGFELDVGGKTTVRIVSQEQLGELLHYVWREPEEMRDLSYLVLYGPRNALCRNCTFFKMFQKVSGEYLGDKFVRYTKAYDANLRTGDIKKTAKESDVTSSVVSRLSPRFHAMNVMHRVCGKMRVFGTERNHPCLSGPSFRKSYWQSHVKIDCDGHREKVLRDIRRYRLEERVYDDWVDKYDLEFLYP